MSETSHPTTAEWTELFRIARGSIAHGLEEQEPLAIDLQKYSGVMREPTATFVTLRMQGELRGVQGELRGCMGNLTADRPLVEDVAENAFAAAFRDPRFPPLLEMEFRKTHIHLSCSAPLNRSVLPAKTCCGRSSRAWTDHLSRLLGQRGTFPQCVGNAPLEGGVLESSQAEGSPARKLLGRRC
ncbi:MAG: AMMECR1 domain-containing protein [Planctomycetales bacterium]